KDIEHAVETGPVEAPRIEGESFEPEVSAAVPVDAEHRRMSRTMVPPPARDTHAVDTGIAPCLRKDRHEVRLVADLQQFPVAQRVSPLQLRAKRGGWGEEAIGMGDEIGVAVELARADQATAEPVQIGRASCRERGWRWGGDGGGTEYGEAK